MATNDDATPSRRGLLKIAATAAATAPAAAAASAPGGAGADAELLALCARWRPALDRSMATLDRLCRVHEDDWSDDDHDLYGEVQADVSGLERRIFETKAKTLAGVRAKAGVLAHLDAAAGIPAEHEQAASLVADVMALVGAAA